MPAKTDPADDESLKRLGGGRWQTRDERFTIEPQSGTWAVVDAEQTDELGLPLVRGPFPSLTAAKAAIASARTSEPATSPLADRVDARKPAKPDAAVKGPARAPARQEPKAEPPADRGRRTARAASAETTEPPEPIWLAELAAAERGRARRLIARLMDAGVADAEGIVRRDLAGGVPAIAGVAIARKLEALGEDARPDQVAAVLAEGRDDDFAVRWRIVDGDGRPIVLDRPGSRRKR